MSNDEKEDNYQQMYEILVEMRDLAGQDIDMQEKRRLMSEHNARFEELYNIQYPDSGRLKTEPGAPYMLWENARHSFVLTTGDWPTQDDRDEILNEGIEYLSKIESMLSES